MTGRGHRWTGVGAAFFAAALARILHLPELVAASMAAGATTLPDWSEIPFYRQGVRAGSLIAHRTLTHWPPLWLLLVGWGAFEGELIGACMAGTGVGALTHILGDARNPMGVPWLLPHRRVRPGRRFSWRSGDHEAFLAMVFGTVGFVCWRLAGGGFALP